MIKSSVKKCKQYKETKYVRRTNRTTSKNN